MYRNFNIMTCERSLFYYYCFLRLSLYFFAIFVYIYGLFASRSVFIYLLFKEFMVCGTNFTGAKTLQSMSCLFKSIAASLILLYILNLIVSILFVLYINQKAHYL